MIAFSEPRILILDDQYSEVDELIKHIWRLGLSCVWHDGSMNWPPANEKLIGVRLVFMDLQFGGSGSDQKQIVSTAIGILEQAIDEKNGPYVIVLWTQHVEVADDFSLALANTKLNPTFIERADKVSFMTALRNGKPANMPSYLDRTVRKAFGRKSVAEAFAEWGKSLLVAQEESISAILKDQQGGVRRSEEIVNIILMTLAKARLGEKTSLAASGKVRMKAAFEVISESLFDRHKNRLRSSAKFPALAVPPSSSTAKGSNAAEINTVLHLHSEVLLDDEPGTLWKIENPLTSIVSELQLAGIPVEASPSACNVVALNLTPECDYAQKNTSLPKFVFGCLVDSASVKGNPKGSHIRTRQMIILNKEVIIIFCINTYGSSWKLGKKTLLGVLSNSMLHDIQHKVASHLARPGYMSL